MGKSSDRETDWEALRAQIIGLGEHSIQKSYYPELERRIAELQRFRALLDQSNDVIFLVQLPSGQFVDANQAACRQLGYSREALQAMSLGDLLPSSMEETLADLLKAKDIAREGLTLTTTFQGAEREVPVEISVTWVSFSEETYAVIVARDITERKQAEEEIEMFKKALDASTDAIGMSTSDGHHYYQNQAFDRMFGDIGDDPPATLYVNERVGREIFQALSEGREWSGEVAMYGRRCQIVDVLLRAYPIKTDGEVTALVGIHTDITGRKRAEQALQESEARNRAILNALPDLIFVQDQEGTYLDYYAAQQENLYTSPKHFLGKKPHEIFPEAFATSLIEFVEQAITTGEIQIYEYTLDLVNQKRYFEARVVPYGEDKVLSVIREITKRKQAEAERERLVAQIHEQAWRIEQVLATIPEGVLLLDAGGRVLQANPVGLEHLHVLAGAQVDDVLTHLGDRALAKLLTSPPTHGLWHEVRAGQQIFEVIARPVEPGISSPEPDYWVLVTSDATQEREIQTQLQQQERLAAVGQLAAGIAHDFNNIMATIVLYAQMAIRSPAIPERERERLRIITQQGWHATRLIEQILDFSRRAVLERHPLDLLPLLQEQLNLLQRTLPENIEIELDCTPDRYVVNADPTRMQQVITNLAVNARDAMPEGGTLHFALKHVRYQQEHVPLTSDQANQWIRLIVSDTGTGIPPDVLPYIFEPFFTTKTAGKGSGLGLAQVHGIVGQHGGHVSVESRLGEGAAFTIDLPALDVDEFYRYVPDVSTIPQGRGEMLLIVEDEVTLRTALREVLELLNYRVQEALDGREALDVMETQGEQIDLVLSDVVMPGMGGIALFHALRQRGWQTPVIFLTGHPMGKEFDALQDQGASAWLLKPPSFERLAQVIARVLSAEDDLNS